MSQARSDPERVLVRCDGTMETGLGHVSRCLALAEALAERGISSHFLGRFEAGAEDLLSATGTTFERAVGEIGTTQDLQGTIEAVKRTRADGLVLDSYRVDDDYVSALDRHGAPLLLIDDFARLSRYECSMVLNFTVNAIHLQYPSQTQLWLLGPDYLLVRRRLRLARRTVTPRSGDVHRVLVAMGGVDPFDLSRLVVQSLMAVAPDLTVRVVVGRSYRFLTELASLVAGFRDSSAVLTQIDDLAEELVAVDLCVGGGGLTKYESAYLGVPTAVLSQTPEQAEETIHFAAAGLATDLGLGTNRGAATELAHRLSNLIADGKLRESLSRVGLACFPEDPTRQAAEALVGLLKERT